jgi:hypothetical protein
MPCEVVSRSHQTPGKHRKAGDGIHHICLLVTPVTVVNHLGEPSVKIGDQLVLN